MTFGSDCSISKAKVDLERVPVYAENCCLNCCYFVFLIQSSVAQLVTRTRVILQAERLDVSSSPEINNIFFLINMLLPSRIVTFFLVLELLNAVFLVFLF